MRTKVYLLGDNPGASETHDAILNRWLFGLWHDIQPQRIRIRRSGRLSPCRLGCRRLTAGAFCVSWFPGHEPRASAIAGNTKLVRVEFVVDAQPHRRIRERRPRLGLPPLAIFAQSPCRTHDVSPVDSRLTKRTTRDRFLIHLPPKHKRAENAVVATKRCHGAEEGRRHSRIVETHPWPLQGGDRGGYRKSI